MNASFFKSGKVGAPRAKEVQKSHHSPKLEPTEKTSVLIITYQEKGVFLSALNNGLNGAVI